jgi:hypothetical protein
MWYSGQRDHEGFPLQLRFPEKPDFDALQTVYPDLLTLTHVFSHVLPSGMPEADYNDSLAGFDHDAVVAFDEGRHGLAVLVETFGGRRTYYLYISKDAPVEAVKSRFASDYPEHELKWKIHEDPDWRFIRRYAKEFKFYPEY